MASIWYAIAVIAGGYQAIAALASLRVRQRRWAPADFAPGVSVLRPIRKGDEPPAAALESNRNQDYPGEFEVLAGSAAEVTPNRKVGALMDLERRAKHPIIVIADADIRVPRDYLRRVVAPLSEPGVGLVTCAYRAEADTLPGRFEGLGVATDFAPSAFVAPFVGIDEFALGATIAVRRADLDRIGGIAAVKDYIADDYQLGRRIHALGLKCVLSDVIVETRLDGSTWGSVWRHQVRWARTIRLSRGAYAGLPVTHATTWALLALVAGYWPLALALLGVRYAMALTAGWVVLRSSDTLKLWWLIPIRDLWATAVWCAGMFGREVEWGGEALQLDGEGRIIAHRPSNG
jgi:ceramide glucosyltransferase